MTVFYRWIAVLLTALLLLPLTFAQGGANKARVELVSERAIAMPGETFYLGLSFEIDPNWHIYWRNAGDAGIPPEILWSQTPILPGLDIAPFEWPAPELLPVVEGEIMDYGYSDRVVLPFAVTLPADAEGPIVFEGVADYLICEDICIPESAPIRLMQSVGAGSLPDEQGAAMILSAMQQVPSPFTGQVTLSAQTGQWVLSMSGSDVAGRSGEARFFPYNHEIVHAAAQPVRFGPEGLQLALTPASSTADLPDTIEGVIALAGQTFEIKAVKGDVLPGTRGADDRGGMGGAVNLPFLILIAFVGGLILNLMPCVLPVLSIKAMGIVSSAAQGNLREARAHGFWYTLGVLGSFAVLAGLITVLRTSTPDVSWGFWMQNPMVVTALVLLIFVVGLWLLGVVEFGQSVQGLGEGLTRKSGGLGAFFTGVLAVIVGAPCTGPFVGVALGSTLTQPAPIVFTVLLAMGLGLALPFLLLSFVPGLQRLLPKPGVWMETLKQAFAFPMFLAAAYFAWTLGDVASSSLVAVTLAGGVVLAFGFWALRQPVESGRIILMIALGILALGPIFELLVSGGIDRMGPALVMLLVLAGAMILVARLPHNRAGQVAKGLGLVAVLAGLGVPLVQAYQSQPSVQASARQTAYPTEPWSRERVAELQAEGRPVFVDFTATWCVNCQVNKRRVLRTAEVAKAFEAADVAFLVADYTKRDPLIAEELRRFNRAGLPMYLWYSAGEREPHVLPELLSIELVTDLAEAG